MAAIPIIPTTLRLDGYYKGVIGTNLNDTAFIKEILSIIDLRIEKKVAELLAKQTNWAAAKVATTGSGATVSLYINNSTTAVDAKNPRSFSLTAGQLVAVNYPNHKLDSMAYIDRIL